jgi:amidase
VPLSDDAPFVPDGPSSFCGQGGRGGWQRSSRGQRNGAFRRQLTYNQALAIDHNAGVNGIDGAIGQFHLDAVVTATDLMYGDHFLFGTSGLAAGPGYPIVQVPAGMVFGVPLGISFFGTAFSEPTLIRLASGFEAATEVRAHNLPTFAETVPFNNIQGTTVSPRTPRAAPPTAKAPAWKMPHHM